MANELTPYQQQYGTWEELLQKAKPTLAELLPRTMPPERAVRLALSQMRAGSPLLKCNAASVLGCVMESAQLGLELNTGGQCWMVPFKGKAQLIIGYQGYIDLAYRTNMLAVVQANVVYENDKFEYHRGFGTNESPRIYHEPNELEMSERGALRGAYMAACLKESTTWILHYMSRPEILERKRLSKAAARSDSPWKTDEAAMWRKTVIREGQRWLPHDYTFGRAVTIDQAAEAGVQELRVEPPIDSEEYCKKPIGDEGAVCWLTPGHEGECR